VVGNLIHLINASTDHRYCRSSEFPIPFEQLDRDYQFMWYSSVIGDEGVEGATGRNLSIESIHDYAYVFVDELFKGNLSVGGERFPGRRWLQLDEQPMFGQRLNLLVERHGRITYPTGHDPKGILSNVTLDGRPVTKWLQCGVDFALLAAKDRMRGGNRESIEEVDPLGPAVYTASFEAPQSVEWPWLHSFFDSRGWGKGVLFINDVNLGIYWPAFGPQMTLFVPGVVFKPGAENRVMLVELMHLPTAPADRTIEFVAEPIMQFPNEGELNSDVHMPEKARRYGDLGR